MFLLSPSSGWLSLDIEMWVGLSVCLEKVRNSYKEASNQITQNDPPKVKKSSIFEKTKNIVFLDPFKVLFSRLFDFLRLFFLKKKDFFYFLVVIFVF